MHFYVGQKVICINDDKPRHLVRAGSVRMRSLRRPAKGLPAALVSEVSEVSENASPLFLPLNAQPVSEVSENR